MKQPISRGRAAAEEQVKMLAAQVVVGFGADHPIVAEAAALSKRIQQENGTWVDPQ